MTYIVDRTIKTNNPCKDIKTYTYSTNDLCSVYTHFDPAIGKNIPTENKLKGDKDNGKSCN